MHTTTTTTTEQHANDLAQALGRLIGHSRDIALNSDGEPAIHVLPVGGQPEGTVDAWLVPGEGPGDEACACMRVGGYRIEVWHHQQ